MHCPLTSRPCKVQSQQYINKQINLWNNVCESETIKAACSQEQHVSHAQELTNISQHLAICVISSWYSVCNLLQDKVQQTVYNSAKNHIYKWKLIRHCHVTSTNWILTKACSIFILTSCSSGLHLPSPDWLLSCVSSLGVTCLGVWVMSFAWWSKNLVASISYCQR